MFSEYTQTKKQWDEFGNLSDNVLMNTASCEVLMFLTVYEKNFI